MVVVNVLKWHYFIKHFLWSKFIKIFAGSDFVYTCDDFNSDCHE